MPLFPLAFGSDISSQNPNCRKGYPMATSEAVQPGDVTQRVGVEVIRARGVDVEKLIKMRFAYVVYEVLP
jgi:hypothetical protein